MNADRRMVVRVRSCPARVVVLLGLLLGLLPFPVDAAERCEPWAAKIVSVEGTIEAQPAQQTAWRPAAIGDTYCPGDKLHVPQWRASIVLANDTIIRLDEGTTITLTRFEANKPMWLELLDGIVHFLSRVPQRLNITTPFVNASVEGTEFVIRVDRDETRIWVFEGLVRLANDFGELALGRNQAGAARDGEAPRRVIVLRPRDAVQWALYYPPIIDYRAVQVTGPGASALQQALEQFRGGDVLGALEALEGVPPGNRDARFFTLRAGMLLSVGRIHRTKADIQAALEHDPDNGIAMALQAVMAVVQTEKDRALELARQAAELAPESPVPQIALSYAYQAVFQLEPALEHAQKATELAPDDSLAWARVAELWLALGYLDDAEEAAQEAVARDPNLARTQTILGFAQLTEMDVDEARGAFEQAIALDPADPLPHLGLGLAKIRRSSLEEGRRDIEIAASLNPNDSLIRSYLGKAYFEETRSELASSQFEMAKELDPNDPTPWFYDAIHKQLVNRPVEALHDLQKSIELNNNRAVYRSQLLLDEDFAARSATLGRIYGDLGFGQRALVEGWYSLAYDPSSFSSHRLLADSYAFLPRHEIARVSELLQSQLLQPLNINNLQPELAASQIQILETAGPSGLSYNEFNPLFLRNSFRFLGNGAVGNNKTTGYDVVPSLIWGPISMSSGFSNFKTGGFRPNADTEHDIFNVFGQAAITPKFNIQAEYRRRETTQGDVTLNFDPEDFDPDFQRTIDQEVARIGARLSPRPHSDFIVSAMYSKREDTTDDPGFFDVFGFGEDEGYQVEARYLFHQPGINATIGGGRYDIDSDNIVRLPFFQTRDVFDKKDNYGYAYVDYEWPRNLIWTGGLTVDSLEDGDLELKKISPKAGVQWNVTDWARLRLAYFQAVKRAIVVNQTIEPTMVAGFNQFFDDLNGTQTENYGIALDTIPAEGLYAGLAYFQRELKVERIIQGVSTIFPRREDFYRGYLYWTPFPQWALSTEFRFEQFDRGLERASQTQPTEMNTLILPVGLKYFHPTGPFAGLTGTFVQQDLDLPPASTMTDDDDSFFLVDAQVGYRFPKRTGILVLEAKNLFDKEFFYQDLNIVRAGEDIFPRFIPDRTIIVRATLTF